MTLRDIDPASDAEIALVAERMRATLMEVEGQALYEMDWLVERVRWHLNPAREARVVLGLDEQGLNIIGHTIFRVESDAASDERFGLISTSYVLPTARRGGLAAAFLQEAERWFRARQLPLAATWTSATNAPLIALYARQAFAEDMRGPNELTGTMMVRLTKRLA